MTCTQMIGYMECVSRQIPRQYSNDAKQADILALIGLQLSVGLTFGILWINVSFKYLSSGLV